MLGNGPAVATLALLESHPFGITLGKNEVLARHEPLGREDRLWLLPDAIAATTRLPADLLQDLASRLAKGRRVGLTGNSHAIGEDVAEKLRRLFKLLTEEPLGHA